MMNPFGLPQPDFGGVSPLSGQPDYLSLATTPMPQAKPKGGMFGGGSNIGTAIAAALNGYLAAGGNQAGVLGLQQLHQQRLLQQKQVLDEQQYAREQADKRSNFTFEQDYKAQHPGPVNNDTVNDYQFILQTLGPDKAREFLETKANPPQFMQVPGLGIVQIPRAGTPSAAQPSSPVGTLRPYTPGGPTQPASGNFPY
jgi:hypothetical protein